MRTRVGLGTITVAVALAAGALVASCGVSSNGIADESPSQISKTAIDALSSARSVYITSQTGTVEFDAQIFASGDIVGTLHQGPHSYSLVKVGGNDYMKASAASWTADGLSVSAASAISDVWAIIPDSSMHLGETISIAALVGTATRALVGLSGRNTGTLYGQASVSSSNSQGDLLTVATTGTPYPISIDYPDPGNDETIDRIVFGNWNLGSPPAVPLGATPISDLGQFLWPPLVTLTPAG